MRKVDLKKTGFKKVAIFFCLMIAATDFSLGQHHELHINPKWEECSFEISPILTQSEWHTFTKEAGLAAYYRPLIDAKPIGKWNFEISLVQWQTKIDESEGAWNNTFVHPDSTHWLVGGPRLPIPGLTGRIGITDNVDVGVYFTKNPQANYGVYGGQLQYNFLNDTTEKWSASARAGFSAIFGPEDLKVSIHGVDLVASKEFPAYSDWAFVSPYAGVSTYLSSARETTDKVALKDEDIFGAQAMVGVAAKISFARLAMEYNFSNTSTLSFRIGAGF
ncbi:MAG: hypothetical protein V4642_15455 [Bacteroidota bacterium]